MSSTTSTATANRKPERLINLTLALLATRRYLTKAEIFASVAGYEGKPETQERMFERDKDDLRSMGIEIEVGNLDPFFEDEPGYKITSDSYALKLSDLDSAEIALLSLAAGLWQQSIISDDAQNALRKLKSLGIPADYSAAGALEVKFEQPQEFFDSILSAIEHRKVIVFTYSSSSVKERTVSPYTLTLWNGFWYLIGLDHSSSEIRTFKASRFVGGVKEIGKANSFQIPRDFRLQHSLFRSEAQEKKIARLLIRKGHAHTLRASGALVGDVGEFDRFEIPFESATTISRQILWHADQVIVEEPAELKAKVLKILGEVVHG